MSLFVNRVSSEEVISDDVSSVSELAVVLVSAELGEDSCNMSSCTGTLPSTSMVVCGWLIAVKCTSIWLRLVVVAQVGFCPGGLGKNLWYAAGIGFDADGLEMVFFFHLEVAVLLLMVLEWLNLCGNLTVPLLLMVLEWGYVMGICVGDFSGSFCHLTQ